MEVWGRQATTTIAKLHLSSLSASLCLSWSSLNASLCLTWGLCLTLICHDEVLQDLEVAQDAAEMQLRSGKQAQGNQHS